MYKFALTKATTQSCFNTAAALRTINQSYVGLGQGNDSIIFGATNVLGASDVFGGKGKDTIVLASVDGANSTINGGNGADLLNLNSATLTTAKIGAGKGTDSIAFGTANNALTGSVAGGGLQRHHFHHCSHQWQCIDHLR